MAIAFDTETHRFGPFNMAPPVVCLTWFDGERSGILVGHDIADFMERQLALGETLVGHNVAYDMACLIRSFPHLTKGVWDAYQNGLVECTKVREKLIAIANGDVRWGHDNGTVVRIDYHLKGLAFTRANMELDKTEWRLDYQQLEDVPLSEWPEGAIAYAINDAIATYKVWADQNQEVANPNSGIQDWDDQANQVRAAWALNLTGVWGIRTDKERTVEMYKRISARLRELSILLRAHAVLRDNGKKDMARIRTLVETELGGTAPRTKGGKIQTSKEVLELCKHESLAMLVEYNALEKTQSTYVERLLDGIYRPIHANFDVLGCNSGRTSCSKPNLQNQPRMPGVRECFVPSRPDWVFLAVDYDSQELRTLAQACLTLTGQSALAEAYQKDPDFDPHTDFAAQVLGISYEEAMTLKAQKNKLLKERRQRAKAANFGFPGGMGAKKFMLYARGYGVDLTLEEAKELRANWLKQRPEMDLYFRFIKTLVGPGNCGHVTQLVSRRTRGFCGYTDAANTYFQGLAADASKFALYVAVREAYTNHASPLRGWHPVNFVHDEIIMEGPEQSGHEAGHELSRIMCDAMSFYTPDVPVRASPTLMRWWSKDAEPVYKDGRLVPWEG